MAHNFEFLDQVDVWNDDVRRSADVGVDDAVEEVKLGAILLTVKGWISKTRTRNANVAFDTADASVLRRRDGCDPGRQGEELCKVSAVQWQILDHFLGNYCSEIR